MIRYEDTTAQFWLALADCYWGPPDEGRYSHDDPDDAIEHILDDMYPGPLTGTAVIVAVRPVVIRPEALDAERVYEHLDEEYGDPDGDCRYEPSPVVADAWAAFVAALLADYRPWPCVEVARVEVDVAAWVAANRPDWRPSDDGGEE